jgi:hypothetical protein
LPDQISERIFIMKNPNQVSTSSKSRAHARKSSASGMKVRTGIRAGWIGVGGGVGPGYHGVGVGRRGVGW